MKGSSCPHAPRNPGSATGSILKVIFIVIDIIQFNLNIGSMSVLGYMIYVSFMFGCLYIYYRPSN